MQNNKPITERKTVLPAELAEYYEVSLSTFNSWLELSPALKSIKDNRKGNYYTQRDVLIIIEHLG